MPRKKKLLLLLLLTCFLLGFFFYGVSVVRLGLHIGEEVSLLADTAPEYTLPSLEDVLRSVHDLDLQKVLTLYKRDHDRAAAASSSSSSSLPQVRIVIASTWRSGSTLLAEILAAHPGVFYHYEPLMQFGLRQIRPGPLEDEATHLLENLLSCDYSSSEEYLSFAFKSHEMFQRNRQLWAMCSNIPRTKCYLPDYISRLCSIFPIHVMKVVRMRLSLLKKLLGNPITRIIWLVRDPRAILNSRTKSIEWCKTTDCRDPKILCSDIEDDLGTFLKLKSLYPDRIMLLRYEDLAKDVYEKSKEILSFCGLGYHPAVQDYLKDHMNTDVEEPWSTRHNPTKRMGRWMKTMSFEDVKVAQYYCQSVIKSLGYRIFRQQLDMASGNAVQLLNLP